MESWSAHQLYQAALSKHGEPTAVSLRAYAESLRKKGFPVIFSLGHLAAITKLDYRTLHDTIDRKRESCNYKMFAIMKRSGGRRFIHTPSRQIFSIQKFINTFILKNAKPHSSSFAFHNGGGIRKCAEKHCSARWIIQFDLLDFFYSIPETRVYEMFKNMGYRNLLSFELARLCTTTRLPESKNHYLNFIESGNDFCYKNFLMGVLPQGAPTSPMISNLIAHRLDEDLDEYAMNNSLTYTRYADDLTFSCTHLPKNVSIAKLKREIISLIRKNKFKENKDKIRVAGPGSKKIVLGLLVDREQPRLSKEMYGRIEKKIYAAKKFGIDEAAKHFAFDSAFGFYNHLCGLISFVNDVDKTRYLFFKQLLGTINTPWNRVV